MKRAMRTRRRVAAAVVLAVVVAWIRCGPLPPGMLDLDAHVCLWRRIERRFADGARGDGDDVAGILAEPGGESGADGAGTDEGDGWHGAMIGESMVPAAGIEPATP